MSLRTFLCCFFLINASSRASASAESWLRSRDVYVMIMARASLKCERTHLMNEPRSFHERSSYAKSYCPEDLQPGTRAISPRSIVYCHAG